MALNLDQKKAIVAEVSEVARRALSAVAATNSGLTAGEMNELRAKARKAGVYMKIVRNTLARKALEGTEFACLSDTLKGPIILALSQEEPGAAARLIQTFKKKHEKLGVTALAIGGQLLPATALATIAQLPSRPEAIVLLMMVLKAAPTKLVRTLAEPHARCVRLLGAIRDQKQKAAA